MPKSERRETRYRIVLTATAANIVQMRKRLLAIDPSVEARIAKIERSPSRADRLAAAMSDAQDALGEVESLHEEVESWKDNLPENLQDGEKAGELEECMSALDEVKQELEEAIGAADNVTFPGMM